MILNYHYFDVYICWVLVCVFSHPFDMYEH